MKVSAALAEIVSEFSGFQHIHASKASSTIPTPSVSRKTSTVSESSRHSLNITVGVVEVNQMSRSSSSSSLNPTASYVIVE